MAQGVKNNEYRTTYEDVSYDFNMLTSTTTQSAIIAAKANFTTYIQAIIVNITTSAAQNIVFQDDASTPVVIHRIANSPGLGPTGTSNSVDFGSEGKSITEGKALDMVISAAGNAGAVKVIAYRKRTTPAAA